MNRFFAAILNEAFRSPAYKTFNISKTLTLPGHFAHSAQFQPSHTKTAGQSASPTDILEQN